jgi:catechol 2,3-dioxygenase-like lactoylglutathione lyase family enzyme
MVVLRIVRPTLDFAPLLRFYCDGLGFGVLAQFAGHGGFDGLIVGSPHSPYHLEFTRHESLRNVRAPTHEHQLVLYLPDAAQCRAAVERMRAAGHAEVEPANRYWGEGGTSFEAPDGWRVVLFNGKWTK